MKYFFVRQEDLDGRRISYDYVSQKQKLQQLFKDQKVVVLKDICENITSGIRIKKEFYTRGSGFEIIGSGDIKDEVIYKGELKTIKPELPKDKDLVIDGDILITSSGKSGQIFYADDQYEGCVITSDIIKIRLKEIGDSFKIYSFLKSTLGQMQIESIRTGILNKLFVKDIEDICIPFDVLKNNIVCSKRDTAKEKPEKLYKEACYIFYRFIDYYGEENFKKYFYISEHLNNYRLDPEYYSNYHSELFHYINQHNTKVKWGRLGDLVKIKTADKPQIDNNEKVRFFSLKDIDSRLFVIKSYHEEEFGRLSNRMRHIVHSGEIVTAKGGSSTGTEKHITALITDKYEGMITTDAFYDIIPDKIDAYYLLFLFKQPIILNQINMFTKGTLYKLIQRCDFENISIPRLNISYESEISKKIIHYISLLQK